MHETKLSKQDKHEALNLITLVNKKENDKIKGQVCANGCKQRQYISEADIAPPLYNYIAHSYH